MQADARKILEMMPNLDENKFLDEMVKAGHKFNISQAIIMVQAQKAIKDGDTKSAKFVRDTSGNKPSDKVEMKAAVGLTRFTDFFTNFQTLNSYGSDEDEE